MHHKTRKQIMDRYMIEIQLVLNLQIPAATLKYQNTRYIREKTLSDSKVTVTLM